MTKTKLQKLKILKEDLEYLLGRTLNCDHLYKRLDVVNWKIQKLERTK